MQRRSMVIALMLALNLSLLSGAVGAEVKLRLMMYGFQTWESHLIDTVVAQFKADNPGISVELVDGTGGDYFEKLATMNVAGVAPDVYLVGLLDWTRHREAEWILPLDLYIQADGTSLKDFVPVVLSAFSAGGHLYALPRDLSFRMLSINRNAFEEAGLRVPSPDWNSPGWTFEDAREVARLLTTRRADGNVTRHGLSVPQTYNHGFSNYFLGNGAPLVEIKNGKLVGGSTSPAGREVIEYLYDLVVNSKTTLLNWGADPFVAGKVTAAWVEPQNVLDRLTKVGKSFEVDIIPFPAGKEGHKSLLASSGWFISKGSKHPTEAWKLLKALTSAEAHSGAMKAGNLAVARISLITSGKLLDTIPFNPIVIRTAYSHLVPGTFFNREADYRGEVEKTLLSMLRGNISPTNAIGAIDHLNSSILEDATLY